MQSNFVTKNTHSAAFYFLLKGKPAIRPLYTHIVTNVTKLKSQDTP